ncbi:CsbD family protein [Streptomyces sp. sk226]|uniref:CsbD family protein n=1 Tax=Streptomyces sp. sk226 TaxID=2034268 RepID=UPI000BEF20FD|nr:CsbD family protein [Streptomyces sp. sk226]
MGKSTDVARAKARRVKGMIKESDGIALDDERLKAEGRREQAEARREEALARAVRPSSDRPSSDR